MVKAHYVDRMIVFVRPHVGSTWAGNEARPDGVGELGLEKPTRGRFCTEVPRMFILDTGEWAEQQFSDCQLGD